MINGAVGNAGVVITSNGAHSTEVMADLCTKRIVSVSMSAHPVIRQQAEAFQDNIKMVIKHYMDEALKMDRASRLTEEN